MERGRREGDVGDRGGFPPVNDVSQGYPENAYRRLGRSMPTGAQSAGSITMRATVEASGAPTPRLLSFNC